MQNVDVVVIGAGAAGLMCAIEGGKRNRQVVVVDHANKAGKKILMSGGGRCNFTNYHIKPENYISHNPHFCKSALSRYTQWDFINLVNQYDIPYHEKTLGQLFCNDKSKAILELLLSECNKVNVPIRLNTPVKSVEKIEGGFNIFCDAATFFCKSLVIATGGLSIPTMGASPFGYKIAQQFDIKVWPLRAGLVPFTLTSTEKEKLACLSGISVESRVSNERQVFKENILFTHRGISGPAILQISSYWNPGEAVIINMLPGINLFEELKSIQHQQSQKLIKNILSNFLPKRIIDVFLTANIADSKLGALSHSDLNQIATTFNAWMLFPNGTEGYRTAEVTLGGVDCNSLSSKTMEAKHVPGLYFIGEVVDVTGWLGGYNFQWAWSSGWAAGQVV